VIWNARTVDNGGWVASALSGALVGAAVGALLTYVAFPDTAEPLQSLGPVIGFLLGGGVAAWFTRPKT
jgi:hypothetical protein